MLPDAMVDPFVVPTEDDEVLLQGELVGDGLGKRLSVGRHVDDFVIFPFFLELLHHLLDGLYHHHHPGVPAVAVVIYRRPRAEAVFPDVVDVYLYKSFLPCTADNRVSQRAFEQLRNYSEDVYTHGCWFRFCKNRFFNGK